MSTKAARLIPLLNRRLTRPALSHPYISNLPIRALTSTATQRSSENLRPPPSGASKPAALGTANRLPEFSLSGKTVLVSGGARGLGLTQAEALLEAGATVYALDRLPSPDAAFPGIQTRASSELGTALHYRQVDVRDVVRLNEVVTAIAEAEGGIDGLVAAAGIQQETPALEYSAEDANRMFEINITGVFMTAQAVARQMVSRGRGGSIVLIGSMSATVANRVSAFSSLLSNLTLGMVLSAFGNPADLVGI